MDWIRSRNNSEVHLGLKWFNSVKALGMVFTYKESEELQKLQIKRYSVADAAVALQGLSLFGKVAIFFSSEDVICILSSSSLAGFYKAA